MIAATDWVVRSQGQASPCQGSHRWRGRPGKLHLKRAAHCHRGVIARAVDDPDHDDFELPDDVVDRVLAMREHAQSLSQLGARGTRVGGVAKLLEVGSERTDELAGGLLGRLRSDIGPDIGEVAFGALGQAERVRPANSCFPRSMMRAGSKSFTRPAATSSRPRSISAFRAASSCT